MGVSGLWLWFVLGVLMTPYVLPQRRPTSHAGTSSHIQKVFLGRCWDYNDTKYIDVLPRVTEGCRTLWKAFAKGFAYLPPCDATVEGYRYFLNRAAQELPKDKVMFWSGVYALAHRYSDSGKNYVTLEDTLVGYLLDSLVWCGQSSPPGINFDRCPEWGDCNVTASKSFWAGASTKFAEAASGTVYLMLSGSDPHRPAYRPNSIFGQYELPSLSWAVKKVVVLLTHVLDKPQFESCTNGSLPLLEKDVLSRGMVYECNDHQKSIMRLLCADNPKAVECKHVKAHARGQLPFPTDGDQPHHFNVMPLDRMNTML